ncbi:hypothetical protein GJ744_010799 [Endocarpon pusillum]|uniref:Uncharacterized protein n=1 Tax=Endocarpon pusillum TaxID=364733 RepID=A0A8H7AHJ5_9EURO|nr:hypothetical protein GJ744_010799 [Endocarpon pusillum]
MVPRDMFQLKDRSLKGNEDSISVTIGKKGPDPELVGTGSVFVNAAGQIDRAQRQIGKKRTGHVDLPPLRLDFDYSPDNQVSNLRRISGA